jgi:hypothetical protein
MHPTPRIERPAPSRTGAAGLAAPASASGAGRAPLYSVTWTEKGAECIVLCSTGAGALKQHRYQMMRGNYAAIALA